MIVLRTVKNGKVRVQGRDYMPGDEALCQERLEGKRLAFGVYEDVVQWGVHFDYSPFLSLWGTERMFKASARMKDEDDPEYNDAWLEYCRLVQVSEEPGLDQGPGLHIGNMSENGDGNWTFHRVADIEWWYCEEYIQEKAKHQ